MALSEWHRKHLLTGGALAAPLFFTVSTVHGVAVAAYDLRRHPVSSLALAPHGWVQTANFVVTGALFGGLAVALQRPGPRLPCSRLGAGFIRAVTAGLVGAGTFLTDPISGYPPGTPEASPGYTGTVAALHDLLSIPTFLGLPAAAVVYAHAFARQRRPGWVLYSVGTAAVMLTGFGLASAAFSQAPTLVANGGLYQRVAVASGFTWLSVLALQARRDLEQPGQ